jgi:hypothetical protein
MYFDLLQSSCRCRAKQDIQFDYIGETVHPAVHFTDNEIYPVRTHFSNFVSVLRKEDYGNEEGVTI